MASSSISILTGLMLFFSALLSAAALGIPYNSIPKSVPTLQTYVQGFVYCKPCKGKAYNLKGAEVGLSCPGSPFSKAFTDQNGYFQFRLGPLAQAAGCRAHAIASHNPNCKFPKGGLGKVTFSRSDPTAKFYSTGPFYFAPLAKCPKPTY